MRACYEGECDIGERGAEDQANDVGVWGRLHQVAWGGNFAEEIGLMFALGLILRKAWNYLPHSVGPDRCGTTSSLASVGINHGLMALPFCVRIRPLILSSVIDQSCCASNNNDIL